MPLQGSSAGIRPVTGSSAIKSRAHPLSATITQMSLVLVIYGSPTGVEASDAVLTALSTVEGTFAADRDSTSTSAATSMPRRTTYHSNECDEAAWTFMIFS